MLRGPPGALWAGDTRLKRSESTWCYPCFQEPSTVHTKVQIQERQRLAAIEWPSGGIDKKKPWHLAQKKSRHSAWSYEKMSVCRYMFSDMWDILTGSCCRVDVMGKIWLSHRIHQRSVHFGIPRPVKVILTVVSGTKEAEGARNGEAGIFCALIYITAGCIAWKCCETAALMVVKLLSKAISDQIRSADGFVMMLPCMLALTLARWKALRASQGLLLWTVFYP